MNFEEIDELIGNALKKKYPNSSGDQTVERRDYHLLEKDNPKNFKGYGERSGVMYLVDCDWDHYIDVNILKNSIKFTFRRDDTRFMEKTFKFSDFTKNHLKFFLYAIDDYFNSDTLFDKFNAGEIPIYIHREGKLDDLI